MSQIHGVICNALTFFNSKLEIMEDINSLLIRHILTNDANSLLLFGNTGEGKLFSNKIEEKFDLINLVLEISKSKIPTIIRLYSNDEEDIIEEIGNLSRRFEDLRYMISPPISKRITVDNLKSYFENILGSIKGRRNTFPPLNLVVRQQPVRRIKDRHEKNHYQFSLPGSYSFTSIWRQCCPLH